MGLASKVDMDLLMFIVNEGEAKKIMRFSSENGVKGGTVLLGEGTARSGILRKLGLDSIDREIVLLLAPSHIAEDTLKKVSEKKQMHKRNRGIGARMPLRNVIGITNKVIQNLDDIKEDKREQKETDNMYQATFIIVDQGDSQDVMTVAEDHGAQGGTVLRGRGAGSAEASRVFNMEIEPQKDILLIISNDDVTDDIIKGVSRELKIEEKNSGILFTVDLSETQGIYDK